MQKSRFLIGFSAAAIASAFAVSAFFSTTAVSHPQALQSSSAYTHSNPSAAASVVTVDHGVVRLAQTHADICLDNETQCLQGCDGAQSCSNQCEVNYQGCMSQGN